MVQLLSSFALIQPVDQATHEHGHILDVLITRNDSPVADLIVDPPSLSDHGLVTCSLSSICPPAPVYISRQVRSWKKIDRAAFRSALQSSPLCRPDEYYEGMTTDELFSLYDATLCDIVDKFAPLRRLTSCRRLTSPWFDSDCRSIKRHVRLLERRYRRTKNPSDRLAWISAIRDKHHAFVDKENQYWEGVVTANSGNHQKLWKSVSTLLGKPVDAGSSLPPFSATDFVKFLDDKVASVRQDTASAPPPNFSSTVSALCSFEPCSELTIGKLVRQSLPKSCELDPIPTFIVKEFVDVLAPILTQLCNSSIRSGCVPASQKEAVVIPALKKHGLDPSDLKSYRPISNLRFTSKLVEKVVCMQLTSYLTTNGLWPKLQSGFRRFHSTETAILKVLSDIYAAIDAGQVVLLALLDVSAAFDTVDHHIFTQRLSKSYGVSGSAIAWFESYLSDRVQSVRLGTDRSANSPVYCGVPQGSILGPLLYVLYTADIIPLVESMQSSVHLYADDTQLYGACPVVESVDLARRILRTVDAVSLWMASNRLRLNLDKTQFMWFGSRQQLVKRDLQQLAAVSSSLMVSSSVRDLGVILDGELSFDEHITKLTQTCYFHLRRLRTIRRSLSLAALKTLVHSFVCNRIDFCNSAFFGASSSTIDRLQSIMNAAARLILNISKFDHISAVMRDTLHWLPVQERIEYKLCFITRNSLAGVAPVYINDLCIPVHTEVGRQHLRSAARGDLLVPRFRLSRYGRRGFYVAGPSLWNSLPISVRQLVDKPLAFKRHLKTFLFNRQSQQHS
jgi:hypothetical protein